MAPGPKPGDDSLPYLNLNEDLVTLPSPNLERCLAGSSQMS